MNALMAVSIALFTAGVMSAPTVAAASAELNEAARREEYRLKLLTEKQKEVRDQGKAQKVQRARAGPPTHGPSIVNPTGVITRLVWSSSMFSMIRRIGVITEAGQTHALKL